ncbi:MAG: hypothetical protein ABSG68_04265 [Thermoguttaceae bacterium]|jgi:hypothetical protein
MPRAAHVKSIDTIQTLANAVEAFRADCATALDDLRMEIRRAEQWIHHDRKQYWEEEVRRGWDRVTEARLALQQARTSRRIADHEPSLVDEKKALERAQRRLELAQRKVEAVRHYTRLIDHTVNEYRALGSQLANWLEAEEPRAVAALKRMMDALEAYLAVQSTVNASRSAEELIAVERRASQAAGASRGGPERAGEQESKGTGEQENAGEAEQVNRGAGEQEMHKEDAS